MEHANLTDLLQREAEARNYFYQLPGYVQAHIRSRGDQVSTLETLRDYAENLTQGDG